MVGMSRFMIVIMIMATLVAVAVMVRPERVELNVMVLPPVV